MPVYYAGWQQPWDFSYPLIYFHLNVLTTTNSDSLDWVSLESYVSPSTISTDAWNVIFGNLVNRLGYTWGSYVQALDDNATYLAKIGQNVTDIRTLLSFMELQSSGLTTIRTLAGSVDGQITAPGPQLSFRRIFTTDIADHFRLGRLGRGWFDNWDMILTVTNDAPNSQPGSVMITGPGSLLRVFQPDSRNISDYFETVPGDTGTLKSLGNGSYLLLEADGTQYAYRSDGNLDYVADAHGTRVTATWTGRQLTQLTHATGPYLQFTYDENGRVATVVDSLGHQTTFTYDSSGEHLLNAQNYRGEQYSYTYNTALGAASQHALTQVINPDGTMLNYTYDSTGRLASRAGCCGSIEQVTFSYDSAGMVTVTDALTNRTKNYLGYQGLLIRRDDALGNVTERNYDVNGNLIQIIDPAGRTRSYSYDTQGNKVTDTDAIGCTTRFTYTSNFNKLQTLIDGKGNRTGYTYNGNGDPTSATYADGTVEQWNCDSFGGKINWINRRGQLICYTNDMFGRLISSKYPDGSVNTFYYDARGNLTNFSDITGTTVLQYDSNDRLSKITYPGGQWLAYTYYNGGQRASITDQLGHNVNYYYDTRERIQSLTDENGSNIVAYTYDAAGRLFTTIFFNGIFTTYGYDEAGHTLDVFNHNPNGTTLSRFQYVYDTRGRRTTMTTTYGASDPHTTLAGIWTYNYDDDDQLIGWTAPNHRAVSYTFDTVGNRALVIDGGTNYIYSVNNLNQYTQIGGIVLQYDADGNLTNSIGPTGVTNYTWSADNRLVGLAGPGVKRQNVYNAKGVRSLAIIDGMTNTFLIDYTDPLGFGVVVAAEYSGNSLKTRYANGAGLVSRADADAVSFYTFDGLGNTSEVSDSSTNILDAYCFLPFGELLFSQESIPNRFQFSGQFGAVSDNDGLEYMRARFYSPGLGRFISLDPIGFASRDANFYRYTGNQPTDKIDPTGLFSTSCFATCAALGVTCHFVFCDIFGPFIFPCELVCVGIDVVHCLACFFEPGPNPPPTCTLSSSVSAHITQTCNGPFDPTQPSSPQDPNSMVGPAGYGTLNYVSSGNFLAYSIMFQNATNATVPAQTVTISDPLTNALDWTTFQLTSVAFGNSLIAIPPGSQHYANTLHLTQNGFHFDLQVDIGLNPTTGLLLATFNSINPTNGLPPPVNVGFLPPETSPATGVGSGYVNYTIRSKSGLTTGTQFGNVAYIQFNQNPALATDLIDDSNPSLGVDTNKMALVTIDSTPPVSAVNPLPAIEPTTTFAVTWSGMDVGSGIVGYDVYVAMNTNPYTLWQSETPLTSAMFTGQSGQTYCFYSAAHDGAGNVEAPHSTPDAVTTVASVLITSCQRGTNGVINLAFTSMSCTTNIVEGSTNLHNWLPVGFVINTNQPLQFSDNDSTNYSTRFYRIRIATNPMPPVIAGQPQSTTNAAGSVVRFTAVVPGPSPMALQWQFNGANLTNGSRISGAQGSVLTISSLNLADTGSYTLVVTNLMGGTNSQPATLVVVIPPAISFLTPCQTILEGTNAVLMVNASSIAPISYQWQFNGTNIAHATNSSLTISEVEFTNTGNYSIIVSNLAGAVSATTCLNVVAFTASQSSPAYYQSPGTLVVSCQVGFGLDRTMYFLVWQPTLPSGWTVMSATGNGNPQISGDELIFDGPFPNPLNFTYMVNIPAGQSGTQQIFGEGLYFLSGITNTEIAPAIPDPLLVNYGTMLSLMLQNGQPQLTIQGDIGRSYRIQSSTDLQTWTNVFTIVPTPGITKTNLPTSTNTMFYRAVAP